MKIIKWHHKKSQPVTAWSEISKIAAELRGFACGGPFVGEHNTAYALHHSQVFGAEKDEVPYNFFCLSTAVPKDELEKFKHWCIINPKILSVDKDHQFRPLEGCMSWPFRKAKHMARFKRCFVSYDYPKLTLTGYELKHFEGDIMGLAAHIFQHEVDHANGKTIFG